MKDHEERRVKRESPPSSSRVCSWRGRRAPKAPRVSQDLRERWAPLDKRVTPEKGVPLDAQAFLGLTDCLALLAPCSCCLFALEGAVTPAPKAPWCRLRSPRLRLSCSRPGWHCGGLLARWVLPEGPAPWALRGVAV